MLAIIVKTFVHHMNLKDRNKKKLVLIFVGRMGFRMKLNHRSHTLAHIELPKFCPKQKSTKPFIQIIKFWTPLE
jgi:hypothetical protein